MSYGCGNIALHLFFNEKVTHKLCTQKGSDKWSPRGGRREKVSSKLKIHHHNDMIEMGKWYKMQYCMMFCWLRPLYSKFLFVLARAVRDPVPKFECWKRNRRDSACGEFLRWISEFRRKYIYLNRKLVSSVYWIHMWCVIFQNSLMHKYSTDHFIFCALLTFSLTLKWTHGGPFPVEIIFYMFRTLPIFLT